MKKGRFAEAQVIGMIEEQEAGLPTAEVCHKHRLSPATFYTLKANYGGLKVSEARRMRLLEEANSKLDACKNHGFRAATGLVAGMAVRGAI